MTELKKKRNLDQVLIFSGPMIFIIGLLLPWYQLGQISHTGISSTFSVKFFVGVVIVFFAIFIINHFMKKNSGNLSTVLGYFSIAYFIGESHLFVRYHEFCELMPLGITVCFLGSVVLIVGGGIAVNNEV